MRLSEKEKKDFNLDLVEKVLDYLKKNDTELYGIKLMDEVGYVSEPDDVIIYTGEDVNASSINKHLFESSCKRAIMNDKEIHVICMDLLDTAELDRVYLQASVVYIITYIIKELFMSKIASNNYIDMAYTIDEAILDVSSSIIKSGILEDTYMASEIIKYKIYINNKSKVFGGMIDHNELIYANRYTQITTADYPTRE